MSQYIDAWAYTGINATNQITLLDSGGVSVTLTNTISQSSTAQRAEFTTLANAHADLTGTYGFQLTSGKILLTCDESFTYTISASMAEWWGFTALTQTGSTSYTGDLQPHSYRIVLGVNYDVPMSMDVVSVREYRHRRHAAYYTHGGRKVRIEVVDDIVELRQLIKGPLYGGKIRVYHSGATPYSLTNRSGFLDVSIQSVSDISLFGPSEDFGKVTMVGIFDEASV